MEVILNGHVIFVTIHWTYANIYIGDNQKNLVSFLGFQLAR